MGIINKFYVQVNIKQFGWTKYETKSHPVIKDGWMTIELSDGVTSVNMNDIIQYTLSYELEE